MLENILTSLNLKFACGESKKPKVGKKTINPKTTAKKTSFFNLSKSFLNINAKEIIKIGETTLAVLNVYIESAKLRAENNKYHFLSCTAQINAQTPKTIKNVATFASNAERDSKICHGEIAKNTVKSAFYETISSSGKPEIIVFA